MSAFATLQCLYCEACVEVHAMQSTYACPYCGSANVSINQHPSYSASSADELAALFSTNMTFSEQADAQLLREFAASQQAPATPEHLPEHQLISDAEQHEADLKRTEDASIRHYPVHPVYISQHYTHSAHVAPVQRPESAPARVEEVGPSGYTLYRVLAEAQLQREQASLGGAEEAPSKESHEQYLKRTDPAYRTSEFFNDYYGCPPDEHNEPQTPHANTSIGFTGQERFQYETQMQEEAQRQEEVKQLELQHKQELEMAMQYGNAMDSEMDTTNTNNTGWVGNEWMGEPWEGGSCFILASRHAY